MIGDMYHNGEETLANTQKAKYWINKSYRGECSKAKEFWKKYNE
jgi:TPR repeat protein